MRLPRLGLADTLRNLPPAWADDPQPAIQAAVQVSREKIIVLDDDPTGTQTVYDVPVLTEWSVAALRAELENDAPVCFILTNSRSVPLAAAQALNADIGRNLRAAMQQTGRRCVVVSRSDSTLRGHFPGEVEALADAMGQAFDAWLLIPFFLEGGRYTIDDVHYVAEGDTLVPAGETEFARDAAFGYQASNLRQWVAEKTAGRVDAETVASVSLEDIRRGGPPRVAERLAELSQGRVCVINAASQRDLEVFAQGLLTAEAQGKRFLYRTAASFVTARAGIVPRALLTPDEIVTPGTSGGLIIVGSHVPRTTSQLEYLLQHTQVTPIEVDVAALLADSPGVTTHITQQMEAGLQRGEDVVLYTSRQLITGADAAASLSISQRVSASLVAMMHALTVQPRYILAKGGITSSDVATQGLGVRRALVLGQILPGVPVWQLGAETRYPGLRYIVFPGNVGGPEAVGDMITALRQ